MLTRNDIQILQHSLGLTYKRVPYRNYYATSPGDPEIERLVDLGLMSRGRKPGWTDFQYYHVTKAGEQLAIEEMPELPKLSRGQKRYQRFLDLQDSYPDMSFIEFLTDPYFKSYRETGIA